jgi:vitamin-K-epoxide reductase (warfarin-sensitive)
MRGEEALGNFGQGLERDAQQEGRRRKMEGMKYIIALLAVAGVVVSSLALRIHYMDSAAAPPCAVSEHWDCGTVNHGKYSVFPPMSFDEKPGAVHIPVAAIGIAGYLGLAGLALARRRFLLFLAALVGLGFALRLTFIEEYALQVWCLYCVISQAVIALITLLSLGWLAAEYIALKRAIRQT